MAARRAALLILVAASPLLPAAVAPAGAAGGAVSCHCYCNIDLPAPCGDESCKQACGYYRGGGGGAVAVPSRGYNLQQQAAMTGAAAVGGAIGNAIGSAIGSALFGNPAEEAARREAQRQRELYEAEQRRLAEEARRRKFEAERDELSRGLKNEGAEALGFKDTSAGGGIDFERRVREDRARREALERMKGKSDEEWCKLHLIGLKRPTRPLSDAGNQYASLVARYRANMSEWDRRCGGPSTEPGYVEEDFGEAPAFTAELSLKSLPDAPPPAPSPAAGASAEPLAFDAPLQLKDLSFQPSLAPTPSAARAPTDAPSAAPAELSLKEVPAAPPSGDAEPAAAAPSEESKELARADFEGGRSAPAAPPQAAPAPPASAQRSMPTPAAKSPPAAKAGKSEEARAAPRRADGPVLASAPVSAPAREEAARLRERALDCALGETLRRAEALGPEGKVLARDLRRELRKVLAGLRAAAPGKGITVFTGTPQHSAKDSSGEKQFVANVLVQRDEETGEVHIDVQASVAASGGREWAAQNLIHLDRSGALLRKEVSAEAEECLRR